MTAVKKTTKKFLAMFLALCILAGMLPHFALPAKADGPSLTYDDDSGVYTINSVADYSNFLADVKSGINYGGKTIILTKDIDLGGISALPDNQNEDYSFKGTFDGLGHTMSNFSQKNNPVFPNLSDGSSVKNLGITYDITVDTARPNPANRFFGGLSASCNGNISNVGVTGTLTVNADNLTGGNYYTFGGIFGSLEGNLPSCSTVKNCYCSVAFKMAGDKSAYISSKKKIAFSAFAGCANSMDSSDASATPSIINCYFNGNFDNVWNKSTDGDSAYSENRITSGSLKSSYGNQLGGTEKGNIFYDSTLASHVFNTSSGTLTITGKSTDDMKKASTYSGWDTSVWNIADGSYPTLKMPASDLTALQAQIAAAEKLSQGNYTAKSWSGLADLLTAAKALTTSSLQYKIDKYTTSIQESISNLVEANVDKSALSNEITKAGNIKTYLYTARSVAPFKTTLSDAQTALNSDEYNQAKVNAALTALQNAESGLVTVKSVLLASIQQGQSKQQEDGYAAKYADYSRKLLDAAVSDAQTWYNGSDDDLTESEQQTLSSAISTAIDNIDAVPSLTKNANGDYTISSPEDLVKLATDVATNGCYYYGQKIVVTQDIDMTGKSIGINTSDCYEYLQGDIDGCKHTISNYSDVTSSLFPQTQKTIKNLNVNFTVQYQDVLNGDGSVKTAAGDFSGWTGYGSLENCTSTGSIAIDTDHLSTADYCSICDFGGYLKLTNCYSRVNFSVTGGVTDKTLYLVGLNRSSSSLKNCYFAGTFTLDSSHTYSNIQLQPTPQQYSSASSSYYDKTLVPIANVNSSYGKTTDEMKTQSTYSGWDFNVVWNLSSDKNDGYPTLRQTNVTYLAVKPVLADKTWDAGKPDDTTATIKQVVFDNVDSATQALIDKYHVKVDYTVQSANYGASIGSSNVTVNFSKLKLSYDSNDTMDFAISSVTPIMGSITDPNATTISGNSTLDWGSSLGNAEMSGISDAKTPRTAAEMKQLWEFTTSHGDDDWSNEPREPVIVGDYTFSFDKDKLYKFNTKTGQQVGVADAPYCGDAYFTIPIYADGKIFVPGSKPIGGSNSSVYTVFDANTMQQLYYINADDLISYGGKLYGSYLDAANGGKNAGFAVFPTADQDTANSSEMVTPSKIYNRVSMTSPVFTTGYALSYDGQHAVALNLDTGKVTQSGVISKSKDKGGKLNYYAKNSRIYVAPATNSTDDCGSVYSVVFNKSDGSFDMSSLKTFNSDVTCGNNNVPIIYNDRVYIGGCGYFMGGGDPVRVLDANTLESIYTIPTTTEGSVTLTTAYATKENNQTVYLYVVPYAPDKDGNSKIYIIKDSAGQTTPSYEVVNAGHTQFCSQSVSIGKDGELVWYNDAKYLYSYGDADSQQGVYTAQDVISQIDRQPNVNDYGYYDSFEIQRINERYNSLSKSEQAKVTNYDKLTSIIAVMNEDPVQRLIDGINSLPLASAITLDDSSKVSSLLAAYNNMDSGNKQKITNADKLLSAEAKIEQLEGDAAVSSVIKTINNLPAVSDLTSDDGAKVNSAAAAYGDLSDTLKAGVTNYSKLQQAQARIAVITQQMSDVQTLIKNKLDGVTVTLDTRSIIKEIDQACTGLAWSDIQKLTNYEYYVSPAKEEIVNLLIKQSIYVNGSEVIPTLQNEDALQSAINEINSYYTGILDCDKIYLEHYDSVQDVQYKISQLGVPAYSETFDNGEVQITAPTGVLPTGAKISITNLTIPSQTANNVAKKFGEDAKVLFYFDVSLTDGSNVKIQPNGTVTVKIKLDSQYKNDKNLVVVYIADDGTITEMPTTIVDGYAVFETTHFSHYALVEKTSKSSSIDTTPLENPKTGDTRSFPLWAIMGIPAGVMAAVCLHKRKRTA